MARPDMDIERVEWDLVGTPCLACGEPVEQGQDVYVDRDASEDGERRREVLSVMHVVCLSWDAA